MAGGSGVLRGALAGLAWLLGGGGTGICVAHLLTSEACLQYPLNPQPAKQDSWAPKRPKVNELARPRKQQLNVALGFRQ